MIKLLILLTLFLFSCDNSTITDIYHGKILSMERGGVLLSASWFLKFKEKHGNVVLLRTDKGTSEKVIQKLIIAVKKQSEVLLMYKPRGKWQLARIINSVDINECRSNKCH